MSNPHELISLLEDTRAQIETLLTRPSVREGVYVSVHGEQARAEEKAAKRLYKQKVPRAERRAIRAAKKDSKALERRVWRMMLLFSVLPKPLRALNRELRLRDRADKLQEQAAAQRLDSPLRAEFMEKALAAKLAGDAFYGKVTEKSRNGGIRYHEGMVSALSRMYGDAACVDVLRVDSDYVLDRKATPESLAALRDLGAPKAAEFLGRAFTP